MHVHERDLLTWRHVPVSFPLGEHPHIVRARASRYHDGVVVNLGTRLHKRHYGQVGGIEARITRPQSQVVTTTFA